MFEVNNQYQQSLLDLAIGHDTHFAIDFYAYDARSSGEWNVVGPCASRSTFERVYKFVRDRHPQLLLQGSLVNQMLTRMIIIILSWPISITDFEDLDRLQLIRSDLVRSTKVVDTKTIPPQHLHATGLVAASDHSSSYSCIGHGGNRDVPGGHRPQGRLYSSN
ncbi:hypothetical protein IFM46972_08699 [Aspergillus udagawae]|uniref:Uncharacterized protein n=1 Tax=Aspergillus udagawae TaxID=91492 RepID=A0A8H3PA42_9EURO|nr:hypothetical protein IFM46972_08699 [Aspergillus udagawae]